MKPQATAASFNLTRESSGWKDYLAHTIALDKNMHQHPGVWYKAPLRHHCRVRTALYSKRIFFLVMFPLDHLKVPCDIGGTL